MPTGWKPPVHIRHATEDEHQEVRDKYHIITEGPNLLPPILAFKDMRLPQPILKQLESKGIKRPTPIQIQGLPIILAGRDMIGVAFTGSGKTLVFALPMIMLALQEEVRMSLERGEAPSWFPYPYASLLNSRCTIAELLSDTQQLSLALTAPISTIKSPDSVLSRTQKRLCEYGLVRHCCFLQGRVLVGLSSAPVESWRGRRMK